MELKNGVCFFKKKKRNIECFIYVYVCGWDVELGTSLVLLFCLKKSARCFFLPPVKVWTPVLDGGGRFRSEDQWSWQRPSRIASFYWNNYGHLAFVFPLCVCDVFRRCLWGGRGCLMSPCGTVRAAHSTLENHPRSSLRGTTLSAGEELVGSSSWFLGLSLFFFKHQRNEAGS